MNDLWSDDFEVLHWVIERFERNGPSIEVGEVLRVFPEDQYDSVRNLLRRLSTHSYRIAVNGAGRERPPVSTNVTERTLSVVGSWPDNAELLADRILVALVEGAVNEPDPEKRFKLKAGLEGVGGMTRDVLVGVVAAAMAKSSGESTGESTGDVWTWTHPRDAITHDIA
ncbi:MAG: hypothetical protein M3186_06940 [Actinomycetota bacterium]|nr:hypothetical protein [Actinomycetota bacterium]